MEPKILQNGSMMMKPPRKKIELMLNTLMTFGRVFKLEKAFSYDSERRSIN